MLQVSNMMSYCYKVLFYVLISVVLLVPLDADDVDCTTELQVRRNTVYEAVPGQELRIDCPVVLCSNSPPSIYWYKIDKKRVPISINGNNYIKIGWEMEHPLKGVSYLIFQRILRSDAGEYRCESGDSVSHTIKVIAIDYTELTTTASFQLWTSPISESAAAKDMFCHYMYRLAGIGAFFVIVISICVTSQIVLKGRCRKTADPCSQSSDQSYENV